MTHFVLCKTQIDALPPALAQLMLESKGRKDLKEKIHKEQKVII